MYIQIEIQRFFPHKLPTNVHQAKCMFYFGI